MNIRRTNATTRRCTFPGCQTSRDQLRDVKKSERLKALTLKKIYIPCRARVCAFHASENSWDFDHDGDMNFKKNHIEGLIKLVTDSSEKFENTGIF